MPSREIKFLQFSFSGSIRVSRGPQFVFAFPSRPSRAPARAPEAQGV